MRRILFAVVSVILSGAMGPRTHAADRSEPVELQDSIVVTANRFGQTEEQSVWPATALTPEVIRRDISLQQTLDGRFGLDLRQSTGYGSISTLSNWGTFARHMLLLYNGRVVKDYSLGGFNLSDFSSDEFERIELLKGPQSAFYGADAIGGVVNLISKSALVDRLELTSRVGSFDLRQYRLDASRKLDEFGLGGFAEFSETDNSRPNSGSERKVFGVRGDFLSKDGKHRLSLSSRYFRDSVGAPGPVPDPNFIPVYGNRDATSLNDYQDDQNYSFDLSYRNMSKLLGEAQIDLFWEKKNLSFYSLYNYLSFYYSPIDGGNDSTLTIDSVDVHSLTVYNKRSAGINGRVQRQLGSATLSAGLDWLSGSLRATADDSSSATNTVGPFAPYTYEFRNYNFWSRSQNQFDTWGASSLELSPLVRLDLSGRMQFVHNRKIQPSYNLGASYEPQEHVRFKIGYGYAFRLPSISEQFADETFVKGSADLKPETSRSIVASAEGEFLEEKLSARVSMFRQTVDSLIQYVWEPSIFRSVPRNVSEFQSRGVDLAVSYGFTTRQRLSLGGVWQKAEQVHSGGSFVDAFYVPDLKWRADFDGQLHSRLRYNVNLTFTSDRSIIMFDGEMKTLDQVYEFGASITASLTRFIEFTLAGYDLTDQARPDQFGFTRSDGDYPTPGRRLVLQVRAGLL